MGEVYETMGIWASDRSYLRNLRMKSDTAAAYSQLPAELLHHMGWTADQPARTFTLADGSHTVAPMGIVNVHFNGQTLPELFIFGEDTCLPVIGSHTLQGFGMAVDPVNHRLIPVTQHR